MVRRAATGPPATRSVLFVHGAMDRAASFGRVMRRLDDVDSAALDRRGYAGSRASDRSGAGRVPLGATLAEHAHDVLRVIDTLGDRPVTLVGHSLGGRIVLDAAASRDPRIESVVVYELPMPELDGTTERVGAGAIELGRRDGPEAAAEHFYRNMVGDTTWERLRDTDREARRAEGPALLAELIDLREGGRPLVLEALTVPVTIGVGATSGRSLRSGSLALHELLGERTGDGTSSRLVELAAAGHGAHLTHADEFTRFVRAAMPAGSADRGSANPFA